MRVLTLSQLAVAIVEHAMISSLEAPVCQSSYRGGVTGTAANQTALKTSVDCFLNI